ncbi:MAG: hypothetical protein R3E02_08780 [Blastomonas sp.]
MNMSSNHEDKFVEYIAGGWTGCFHHCYPVTRHAAWESWHARKSPEIQMLWHCNSLKEAHENYSWTGQDASGTFENLSKELICAVRKNNSDKAKSLCRDIFKWGGVGKKRNDRSIIWLNQASDLCASLNLAKKLLLGSSPLSEFNGTKLLMNSAMTKVYAALAPRCLAIYDGRVGAALGLLAKQYLYSVEASEVPEELQYRWGASQGKHTAGQKDRRDPSDDRFKFNRLFGRKPDHTHAELMRRASTLLSKVANKIDPNDQMVPGKLERALFMIGYDVRNNNCRCSKQQN